MNRADLVIGSTYYMIKYNRDSLPRIQKIKYLRKERKLTTICNGYENYDKEYRDFYIFTRGIEHEDNSSFSDFLDDLFEKEEHIRKEIIKRCKLIIKSTDRDILELYDEIAILQKYKQGNEKQIKELSKKVKQCHKK